LAFQIPTQPYSGKIGSTTIGTGKKAVTLGGEESYPFHLFEGKSPNPPKIAMEVWDYDPSGEWPAAAVEAFKDVMSSPEAWAKKCVDVYGADIIVLQLKSTDPNGLNRSADDAAKVAKKVADAVDVPLIVWGTANTQKDEEVLKKIAEACQGKNLALAPVEEGNHKGVGASALGYGHCVVASSPIDVNLAKQLNILLGNLGVKPDKIIIDPTTGGLGYGLEYSYSVMERIRMAGLTQEDDKLQMPIVSNIGNEIWKCKEAGLPVEESPTLGDTEKRAIMMECVAAAAYLMAGSDVVILRHPESVRLIRSFIELMIKGGMATGVAGVKKALAGKEFDLAALAPAPNLEFAGQSAPAPKAAPPKAEKPKAEAPKVEKPKAEPAKKAEAPKKVTQAEEKAKKEAEAKAKAEAEAKAKAEAEAKAKKEAEARAKEREKQELEALRKRRAEEKKETAEKPRAAEAKAREVTVVERLEKMVTRFRKHS
jgi:acetyl-CoA decarbonylase/synthase complex subunit delta